jgi:hypothetical protein
MTFAVRQPAPCGGFLALIPRIQAYILSAAPVARLRVLDDPVHIVLERVAEGLPLSSTSFKTAC